VLRQNQRRRLREVEAIQHIAGGRIVSLIPQVCALPEEHRAACGHPSGPIFANGAGNELDLDWLYRRQMKEPLRRAGMEREGRRGTALGEVLRRISNASRAGVHCCDDLVTPTQMIGSLPSITLS
jgi:hypothetical protein